MKSIRYAVTLILASMLVSCATESHHAVVPEKVESYRSNYTGERTTLVVGNFQNRSNYMNGLFSSDVDQLGNQAKTILKTHLQQTNRFKIVDRENMEQLQQEAKLSGIHQNISGARYVLSGGVTEFGRKEVGDRQLFGILGRGKEQVAYAKVSLTIVDVINSNIIYSTQGGGEYALSNREIVGFGGTSGYDATLNGKVLNFAITEVVNNLVRDIDTGVLNLDIK